MKITWKAGTLLYPIPAVMVTAGHGEETNVMTIAWTGIINSEPAMTYISVRPERHSYELIKKNMEFVINLPTISMLKAADFCGVRSGSTMNKIKEMNLELEAGDKIETPSLKASPISLECKVKSVTSLGSHDMFIAEIVSVRIDDSLLDEQGVFRIEKAKLFAYCHGTYFALGEKLGRFGFSVEGKKAAEARKERNKALSKEIAIKKGYDLEKPVKEKQDYPVALGDDDDDFEYESEDEDEFEYEEESAAKKEEKDDNYRDEKSDRRPSKPFNKRDRDEGDRSDRRPSRPYNRDRNEGDKSSDRRPSRPYNRDRNEGDKSSDRRPSRPYNRDRNEGDKSSDRRPSRPYNRDRNEGDKSSDRRPSRPYNRDRNEGDKSSDRRPSRPYNRDRNEGDKSSDRRPSRPYNRDRNEGDKSSDRRPSRPYNRDRNSSGSDSKRPSRPYTKK